MNNRKENASASDLIPKTYLHSTTGFGRERMRKQNGFVNFKLLVLVIVIALVIVLFFV